MTNKKILDEIVAKGHINVLGLHKTTLEVTKEDYLTKNGDCIIGINSDKAVKDLSPALKKKIRDGDQIHVVIKSGPFQDEFTGWGNSELTLSNPISAVFRKSNFISDRTILIHCSKSSSEINRDITNHLQDPDHKIQIIFYSMQ